ncbi:MAG TPA: DUF4232 domain-containing protein [Solirubrobacteraceae bacterium]|nr:DUF4232 domain-containing protein [Solirubrobacteraceae bacterium]
MGFNARSRTAWMIYGSICVVLTVITIGALVVNANPGAAASTPSRCLSSQLTVAPGRSGGAAGSIGVVVHFHDRSGSACTLEGYPGMQMLNAAGGKLATEVHRGASVTVPSIPVRQVTLDANGGEASFDMGYADATGFGNEHCPTSSRVEITAPNDYRTLTISWAIQPYGGDIPHLRCGQINVSPVFAGASHGA